MGALNIRKTTLKIGKMGGCFEYPFANYTIYSGDASFVRLLLDYWGRDGQLLATFSMYTVTVSDVLANNNPAQFPSRF